MLTASEVHMFDLEIAPALRDFMGSNLCDANDCVDWVCYTFNIDASDFIIERVCDEFDCFFGN